MAGPIAGGHHHVHHINAMAATDDHHERKRDIYPRPSLAPRHLFNKMARVLSHHRCIAFLVTAQVVLAEKAT